MLLQGGLVTLGSQSGYCDGLGEHVLHRGLSKMMKGTDDTTLMKGLCPNKPIES